MVLEIENGMKVKKERVNKMELVKIIAMLRDEEYGVDLVKEVYISSNDVYKKAVLKKIS